MINKYLIIFVTLIILTQPSFALAECYSGRFIPCDGTDSCPCTFESFMTLIKNILDFFIEMSFPLAIISFSWAGFKLLTSQGNPAKKDEAKRIFVYVLKGFVVILASWLIVRTAFGVLFEEEIVKNLFQI